MCYRDNKLSGLGQCVFYHLVMMLKTLEKLIELRVFKLHCAENIVALKVWIQEESHETLNNDRL